MRRLQKSAFRKTFEKPFEAVARKNGITREGRVKTTNQNKGKLSTGDLIEPINQLKNVRAEQRYKKFITEIQTKIKKGDRIPLNIEDAYLKKIAPEKARRDFKRRERQTKIYIDKMNKLLAPEKLDVDLVLRELFRYNFGAGNKFARTYVLDEFLYQQTKLYIAKRKNDKLTSKDVKQILKNCVELITIK